MWFSNDLPKKSEEIRTDEIRFLGEQDGPSEQILKEKLIRFFQHEVGIIRAYLARFDFGGEKNIGVVLGLKTKIGPDKEMVEKIGAVFASVFNAKEHLDILFLTDNQESQLAKVCKPFFKK